MLMLDLGRLEILVHFSQLGSIAATAESLGYSASAISQQLVALEREIGRTLLERTARSAALTDTGRLLVGHAVRLLAEAERVEAEMAAHSQAIGGRLIVSTIPSLAVDTAQALAAVQRDHPALEIVMRQLDSRDAAAALEHRLTDIALLDDWSRTRRAPSRALIQHQIHVDPVVLAVPAGHSLAESSSPLSQSELAKSIQSMTLLSAPEGHMSRLATDQRLRELTVTPARRWEFEGLATLAELVATGAGCAFLPRSLGRLQAHNRLVLRGLTPPMERRIYALHRAASRTSPAVELCLRTVSTCLLKLQTDPSADVVSHADTGPTRRRGAR